MDRLFVEVDAALAAEGGPYFLGDDISLVDIMFTPFLERMAASLPYYKVGESTAMSRAQRIESSRVHNQKERERKGRVRE